MKTVKKNCLDGNVGVTKGLKGASELPILGGKKSKSYLLYFSICKGATLKNAMCLFALHHEKKSYKVFVILMISFEKQKGDYIASECKYLYSSRALSFNLQVTKLLKN